MSDNDGIGCAALFLELAQGGEPALSGKRLGVVNGSAWDSLWSMYFGKQMLPGVKITNVGNEAVQLNFMHAYHNQESVPPQINIDLFRSYAEESPFPQAGFRKLNRRASA